MSHPDITAEIENQFTYHAPNATQLPRYQELRNAGKALALAIARCCPPGADRSAALRKVREAVMTGNAAIALEQPLAGVSSGEAIPGGGLSGEAIKA